MEKGRQVIKDGFGLAIHVIGDRAARVGLDVIEAVRDEDKTGRLRHRLEHVQLLGPGDLERLAKLDVIASVQPTHATTDRDNADHYWGAERITRAYAYKSMLQHHVPLALGSDAPIKSIDPRKGIYAAVTRKREGEQRLGWHEEECLTVEEAVRGFTIGSAYAANAEKQRGQITPGFQADLTALAQDIFIAPHEEIPVTPITATIVGGKVVYSNL